MRKSAEVVIVGGGIIGTSVAYNLAKLGLNDVVVLEKDYLSAGSTGRCGGGMRQQWSTKTNILLARHSIETFKNFREEMGQDIHFRQGGYLLVAYTEEMVSDFKKNIALQNSIGVDTKLITPDEVREISPILDTSNLLAAAFGTKDGVANPFLAVKGYADRARDLGVEINIRTTVTGMEAKGDKVTLVKTTNGDISTKWVINAAGAWAGEIGKMLNLNIPVVPYRRQIMVTEAVEVIHPCMVIDLYHNIYFSQAQTGGFISGQTDKDEKPGFDITNNSRFLVELARKLVYHAPVLRNVNVVRQWSGLYEVTPDAQPIIGRIKELDNFYVVAGFSGHGFMLAPAAAVLTAEEICYGKPRLASTEEMSMERFKEGKITKEKNVV
ncbi:MAG: FAD-binding oxidoreductase [Planctomycetota bacterium]